MSSENTSVVHTLLTSIETDYESSRVLNDDLVKNFFDALLNFENGSEAVKQFVWFFGMGEKSRHMVESNDGSKECRKVFLIDFKQSRKYLHSFVAQQDWIIKGEVATKHYKDTRKDKN